VYTHFNHLVFGEPVLSGSFKSEGNKKKGYKALSLRAIDDGLRQVLGDGAKTVSDYLEINLTLPLEDAIKKPELFKSGLEQLMDSAALKIEEELIKNLHSTLGMEYVEREGYTFGDCLKEITKDLLTVVLPALNEEKAVVHVIDELKDAGYERILLVDGHSTDRTVELAHERGVTVITQTGVGKAGAVWTAIQKVKTPYLVIMDCDYTYDPQDIASLFRGGGENDLVIGVRTEGRFNISFTHRFGNWVIRQAFKYLFGSGLNDVCSGMYLLKTETAKQMNLSSKGFAVEVDVASQMLMRGSVGEVPISYRKRIGKRKLSSWSDGCRIFFNLFSLTHRHNPMFLFLILAFAAGIPAVFSLVYVILEVLLREVWHSGVALFGGISLIIAFQCFMIAVFSVLMKRMDKRIERSTKR